MMGEEYIYKSLEPYERKSKNLDSLTLGSNKISYSEYDSVDNHDSKNKMPSFAFSLLI